jgi:hypothetical protein
VERFNRNIDTVVAFLLDCAIELRGKKMEPLTEKEEQ